MKYPTKTIFAFIATCTALSLSLTTAQAGKMYKWVDKDGRISYQDSPPPKSGKILEETEVATSASVADTANAAKPPIRVYTVINCEPCGTVVQHLKKQAVPVVELPLQNDREAQSLILEQTESLIAPTVFVGEKILQGGDLAAIDEALRQGGYELAADEQEELAERSARRLTLDEEESDTDSD